jgi:hypothetical protein
MKLVKEPGRHLTPLPNSLAFIMFNSENVDGLKKCIH